MVDYQNCHRPLLRFELKPQLLIDGFEKRDGSGRVGCPRGGIARRRRGISALPPPARVACTGLKLSVKS